MVKAGAPVDELIEECLPFLEKGDILIDGGNSLYTDTDRREKELKAKGIFFIGAGISGGEEVLATAPRLCQVEAKRLGPLLNRFFKRLLPKLMMAALAVNGSETEEQDTM
jgi:6-phosphogluconate dehydrogenase